MLRLQSLGQPGTSLGSFSLLSAHSNASLTQRAGGSSQGDISSIWGCPSAGPGGPSGATIDRYNQLLQQQAGGPSSRRSSLDSTGTFPGEGRQERI